MKKLTSLIVAALATVLFTMAPTAQAAVVTFQEGDANGYAGTADVHLVGNNNTNWGTEDLVLLRGRLEGPGSGNNGRQGQLMRFDNIFGAGLSQVAANSVITSATYTMWGQNAHATSNTGKFTRMRAFLSGWDEFTAVHSYRAYSGGPIAAWGNLGGTAASNGPWEGDVDIMDGAVVTSAYVGNAGAAYYAMDFDVTEYVKAWNDDFNSQAQSGTLAPMANNGVVIDTFDQYIGRRERMSENSVVAERPMLSITFEPIPEPASVALMGLGGLLVGIKRRNK